MTKLLLSLLVLVLFAISSADAGSPVGNWNGQWRSSGSGHKGPLRAKVQQTSPTTYRATFSGRFALVIPFVYRADLKRVPGSCDCYQSSRRLPLFGQYNMTAKVTPNRFYAQFQGKKDGGIFDMKRR